jgi:hypothetical protein
LKRPRSARIHFAIPASNVFAAGNLFPDRFVRVERAALIDVSQLHSFADLDLAAVRFFLSR